MENTTTKTMGTRFDVIHKRKKRLVLEMTQGDLADKVFGPKTEKLY
jgi:hypothetical protein